MLLLYLIKYNNLLIDQFDIYVKFFKKESWNSQIFIE